jgi:uncharacterized protein YndB with AHSA1/START domain
MPAADLAARSLVVERTFDARRELVWEAFTEVKHLDQWWGPNGFRNDTSAMKLEVGGTWRYVMHGPDGKVWPNWIRYQDIRKPERLVYDHGGETDEPAFHVTITFAEVGKKTKVTMTSLFPTVEALEAVKKYGVVEGGQQTLARLAGRLQHMVLGDTDQAVVVSRLYDAPVELVFQAWSSAEALAKWWGPKGMTSTAEVDFKVGGKYRIVMRDAAGNTYPFHGTYREIVPNARIVFHALIEGANLEVNTTVTFTAQGDKTLLTVRQDRPANPDMARGQFEGLSGQLEKLAAVLRAA